jgi:hypothetical protein
MESHNSSLGASPAPDSPTKTHAYRAAKTHPLIKIEPNSLVFPPPHFGRCIQNAISIYNVSKQPGVFKMRSQNPERYVAKPHVAVVAPESATRIFVTLRDMNTLGLKNLPEDTHDRFRISLKLYDPSKVDATLSPKELWNVLDERGAKVDHEQDLLSYFTMRDTPVGGLVTFFPPTYIPVTPTAHHRTDGGAAAGADGGANDTPSPRSAAGNAASRALGSDMDDAAKKISAAAPASTAKAGANAPGSKSKSAGGRGGDGNSRGTGEGKKARQGGANKMPALWVGIAVAAFVVVSLAVGVGVTLRGRSTGNITAAASTASAAGADVVAKINEEALQARVEEETRYVEATKKAELLRATELARAGTERARVLEEQQQQQAEEAARVLREQQAAAAAAAAAAEQQARMQQEAEAERLRVQREQEDWARAQAEQQARAAQEAAEAEAERLRAAQQVAEEEVQRLRLAQEEAERNQAQQAAAADVYAQSTEDHQHAEKPHEGVPQEEHRTVEPQLEQAGL